VGEKGKSDELPGADIAQHLARHGISIEVKSIVAADAKVADVILSHAADSSADFLVMGGFGHSRSREFILGGVTRSTRRRSAMSVSVRFEGRTGINPPQKI
jgi:nucleotide-binding universal stress UspA family protein